MIQTKHFGSNKIKKRHKKTEVCWCFKSARCNVILFFIIVVMLELSQNTKFSFLLSLNLQENVFLEYNLLCPASWYHFCSVEHQPGLFVNVDYCFLSLDISTWPPARWTWWRGMEGRCWWACSVHAYNAVEGHALGGKKKWAIASQRPPWQHVHLRTSVLLYTLVS